MIYVNREANNESLDSDTYLEIDTGGTVTLTQKGVEDRHNDMICIPLSDIPRLVQLLQIHLENKLT